MTLELSGDRSSLKILFSAWMIFLLPLSSFAQDMGKNMMGQSGGSCCVGMGTGMMILSGVLVLAIVAALIALTVFLIRKSRT